MKIDTIPACTHTHSYKYIHTHIFNHRNPDSHNILWEPEMSLILDCAYYMVV